MAGRENLFPIGYQWEPASAEAWGDQWSDIKSRGRLFAMTAPDGETTLQCCTGGDVVLWTVDGETHYACVTAAAEGESGLSGLLQGIAEDALWDAAFCGPTVDGAEMDYEEIARAAERGHGGECPPCAGLGQLEAPGLPGQRCQRV